jgi:hypothetical protein
MFKIPIPETESGIRQFRLTRNGLTLSKIRDIADGFRACGMLLDFKNGIGRIENCEVNRAKLYNDLNGSQLRLVCNAFDNGVSLFDTNEVSQ